MDMYENCLMCTHADGERVYMRACAFDYGHFHILSQPYLIVIIFINCPPHRGLEGSICRKCEQNGTGKAFLIFVDVAVLLRILAEG